MSFSIARTYNRSKDYFALTVVSPAHNSMSTHAVVPWCSYLGRRAWRQRSSGSVDQRGHPDHPPWFFCVVAWCEALFLRVKSIFDQNTVCKRKEEEVQFTRNRFGGGQKQENTIKYKKIHQKTGTHRFLTLLSHLRTEDPFCTFLDTPLKPPLSHPRTSLTPEALNLESSSLP